MEALPHLYLYLLAAQLGCLGCLLGHGLDRVQVINEDAVLEAIRGVLRERGQGEEVVVFNKARQS